MPPVTSKKGEKKASAAHAEAGRPVSQVVHSIVCVEMLGMRTVSHTVCHKIFGHFVSHTVCHKTFGHFVLCFVCLFACVVEVRMEG